MHIPVPLPPPTPYLPPCCCCCWCFTPLSAVVLALLLLLLQFAYLQKVQGRTPKEPLALLELLTNLFGQHTRPSRQSPVSSHHHHHRNSRSHSDSRSACPSSSSGLLFSSSNYGRVQGSILVRFFGFRFSVLSLIVGLVSLSVSPSPPLPLSLCLCVALLRSVSLRFWFLVSFHSAAVTT